MPSSLKNVQSLISGASRTPPVLSKFEKALILGHRCRELSLGAKTSCPLATDWKPAQIAEMELNLGLLDDYAINRAVQGSQSRKESWMVGDFHVV